VLNLNWVVIRTPLRTHVLGYLQRVAGYLGDHPQLMVSVEAHDGRGLGHVKLTREQLNVVRRGNEPPDQIRLLEDDLDPAFEVEVSIPEDVGPAS
jgi:hypothetical protein